MIQCYEMHVAGVMRNQAPRLMQGSLGELLPTLCVRRGLELMIGL